MMSSTASTVLASGLKFGFDHSPEAGLAICGVLMLLSVITWSLMISKLWMLWRSRRANSAFLRAFHDSPHPLAIFQAREHHARAPLYHIYHAGSRELAFHLLGTDEPDATFSNRLNSAGRIMPSQMSALTRSMERAVTEAGVRIEANMSGVAAALRGAAFLGLLGLAWGLMDGFAAVAGKSPDGAGLQDMAPGLCAALVPFVGGLFVAVPGMLVHALLTGRMRALMVRLHHFTSEFGTVLDRHFVDHGSAAGDLPSFGSLGAPSMPAFGGALPQTMQKTAMPAAVGRP